MSSSSYNSIFQADNRYGVEALGGGAFWPRAAIYAALLGVVFYLIWRR